MYKYERSEAIINLDAISHNMEVMHQGVPDTAEFVGVIKADGYGHGAREIAHEIEDLDYLYGFATATIEEALELRREGVKKAIMVLGYVFPSQYEEAIKEKILLPVFDFETAKALSDAAVSLNQKADFQFVIDTGMHRIGYPVTEEAAEEIAKICALPNLHAEGMFTHFFLADAADKSSAREQYDKFCQMNQMLLDRGIKIPHVHCSNSAALIDMPDMAMDLVRAGITLYGLLPSDEVKKIDLQPVMEVRARVTFVKTVEKGGSISYGATYTAAEDVKIATIGFGYADGYPRQLSNKGWVLIHGKKAPICGRVCMDQFMVDVSEIPDAKCGDEAVLIGRDGEERITMEELGELSGRFNYELACDISKRVPRVYIKNGSMLSSRDAYKLD